MELPEIFRFLLLALFLLLIEVFYFRIARRYHIVDHPNERSSHTLQTLRGGGVIFPIGMLTYFFLSGFTYPYFVTGLLLISFISFYDDLRTLSSSVRMAFHFAGVALLLTESGIIQHPNWIIAIVFVLITGTINAYNFMDGINGITGAYSLVTVLTLAFINENISQFADSGWLIVGGVSLLVFNIFNFRTKAVCFAGDIGSVSIAFIIIFFIALLIIRTEELKYIGLLAFYGYDTVTTIVFRLIRGENIFVAHRSHFYQYLVNIKKWPHLRVAVLYALSQLLVNSAILGFSLDFYQFIITLLLGGVVFVAIRWKVEGKVHLMRANS
jgi:UDP-GlcNAc:undecaprenyl-phosphate GlcNAc-1-phosphate transferase